MKRILLEETELNVDSWKWGINHIERPYLPINKDFYTILTRHEHDILKGSDGRYYTFGNADGGYALMPFQRGVIEELLADKEHMRLVRLSNG